MNAGEVTEWAEGDPPMVGWWDTIIPRVSPGDGVTVGSISLPEDQVWRRWWSGPISGWSAAVIPAYAGYPLQRIAEMPFRPADARTVILYRGLKAPAKYYPFGLNQTSLSTEALAAAMGAAVVMFPHLSESFVPKDGPPPEGRGARRRRIIVWEA